VKHEEEIRITRHGAAAPASFRHIRSARRNSGVIENIRLSQGARDLRLIVVSNDEQE
jgi:hypothetical protein